MKTKLLLGLFIGTFLMSCSVDPIEEELSDPVQEFNSSFEEEVGCAGTNNSKTITYSEAAAIESWDEVRKLYLSLLEEGVSRDGNFDPSIDDIIDAFNEAENPLGEFTTTYYLEGDCEDSVELTIVVVSDEQQDPCEGITAGADNSKTITYSEAAAIESWDEVRKLYLSLLEEGVSREGDFDPSIWDLINAFNEAEDPLGEYTTTYTITEGDCSASVRLTVIVVADEQQDPCGNVSAGADNSKTITFSEAVAIESWDEVRKLYLSLLEPGVSRVGEFDPSIWDIINAFNEAENPLGEYTTTYTITEGDCSDSVELTIIVVQDQQQEPVCDGVNAGADNSKTLTVSEAAAIPSWDEVRKLYLSLLETGVPRDGSFDPSIWDIINAFNENEDPTGEYTTTYTITEGECSDSVELTIVVVEDPS